MCLEDGGWPSPKLCNQQITCYSTLRHLCLFVKKNKKNMVNRNPTRTDIQRHWISLPLRKHLGWSGVELTSLPHWAVMHQSHLDQPDPPLYNRISEERNVMHNPQQCQPRWWDIKPAHKTSNCICKSEAKQKPAPINETWWNTGPIFRFKQVMLH